jgi:HAD superfamily hydrolase (TIGR01458 family)
MGSLRNSDQPSTAIRGVLLDLGGVLYVGGVPIDGACLAVQRLRDAGLPLRFLTNTTRRSRRQVLDDLRGLGFEAREQELLTPAVMARSVLEERGLSPILLVHPNLEEDFLGIPAGYREAVVVGDAGEDFTYRRLNQAYRKLAAGAPLLALAKNRSFQDADGELSLDAGPFIAALEYASGATAFVIGKPSLAFFQLAVDSLGHNAENVAMIGDDAEADIEGAQAAGLLTILVRTGKYRDGDEGKIAIAPHHVVDRLDQAVCWVLEAHHAPAVGG